MKKIKITEKAVTITAAIGSVLIMLTVIANTYWASRQAISSTNQAVSAVSAFYLESMADRRSKTITNLIKNNFESMEVAVSVIDDEKIGSQEDLRDAIGRMKRLLTIREVHILRCIPQMVETFQKQSLVLLLEQIIFLMPQKVMFPKKSGTRFAMILQRVKKVH